MKKKANFFKQQTQDLVPVGNIVSEWRFLSSDGYADSVGSNTLTQVGSIAFTSGGIIDDCLNVTSSTAAGVVAADDDSLSFGNGTTDSPFSFSMWIYTFPAYPLTTSVNRFFVDKRATDNSSREYTLFWFSGSLAFRLFDTSSNGSGTNVYIDGLASLTTLADDTWYHIAWTYDGSGSASGMNIYLDNTNVTTGTGGGGGTYTAMGNKPIPLYIGRAAHNTSNSFVGYMDEVVLFDKELSAEEVDACYNKNLGGEHLSE